MTALTFAVIGSGFHRFGGDRKVLTPNLTPPVGLDWDWVDVSGFCFSNEMMLS